MPLALLALLALLPKLARNPSTLPRPLALFLFLPTSSYAHTCWRAQAGTLRLASLCHSHIAIKLAPVCLISYYLQFVSFLFFPVRFPHVPSPSSQWRGRNQSQPPTLTTDAGLSDRWAHVGTDRPYSNHYSLRRISIHTALRFGHKCGLSGQLAQDDCSNG